MIRSSVGSATVALRLASGARPPLRLTTCAAEGGVQRDPTGWSFSLVHADGSADVLSVVTGAMKSQRTRAGQDGGVPARRSSARSSRSGRGAAVAPPSFSIVARRRRRRRWLPPSVPVADVAGAVAATAISVAAAVAVVVPHGAQYQFVFTGVIYIYTPAELRRRRPR